MCVLITELYICIYGFNELRKAAPLSAFSVSLSRDAFARESRARASIPSRCCSADGISRQSHKLYRGSTPSPHSVQNPFSRRVGVIVFLPGHQLKFDLAAELERARPEKKRFAAEERRKNRVPVLHTLLPLLLLRLGRNGRRVNAAKGPK